VSSQDLDKRPRRFLLAVLGLAVCLRIAYLLEYLKLPFIDGPLYDSLVYLRQAGAIHAGLFDDASLLAFSPLYGWFLAALGGRAHMVLVVVVQLALGCAAVALVFRITRRLFGPEAALAASLLHLGYGLFLFYESKILSETLGLTLALVALDLYLSRPFIKGRLFTGLTCGTALALAVLARASLLLALPFFLLAAMLPWGRSLEIQTGWTPRLRRAGAALLGITLTFTASGLWNYHHSGLFVPVIMVSRTIETATASPWNASLSVHSRSTTGGVSPFDVVRDAEIRIAAHRQGTDRGPLFRKPHIDVTGWLSGAPAKIAWTLADVETSFQYGYYGERTEVLSLRLLPLSFGFLVLLGLLGAWFAARRYGARTLVPLLPLVLGALLTTTLYHPSSRYRVIMLLPLLSLGGLALHGLVRTADRRRKIVCTAAAALVFSIFAWKTWTYQLRRPGLWHLKAAESALAGGHVDEAGRRIESALKVQPGDPQVLKRILDLKKLNADL
jgi:4-amino-4-deoxy-L-arabinose transferase-like glycosyltransferase